MTSMVVAAATTSASMPDDENSKSTTTPAGETVRIVATRCSSACSIAVRTT